MIFALTTSDEHTVSVRVKDDALSFTISGPLAPTVAGTRLTLADAEALQKLLGKACAKLRVEAVKA